jgi:hypothetical protein
MSIPIQIGLASGKGTKFSNLTESVAMLVSLLGILNNKTIGGLDRLLGGESF